MQSQQPPLSRSDSPVDKNNQNMLHHHNSQEPIYIHGQFTPTNGTGIGSRHLQQDYPSDLDAQNQQPKPNGFGPNAYTRNTFNAYPNRSRHQNSPSVLATANYYPSSADVLGSQLTSPVSTHMPTFDNRPGLDIGPGPGNYKSYFDGFPSSAGQPHQVGGKSGVTQLPQHNSYSAQASSFTMSSQTPYGPHIPTGGAGHAGSGAPRLDHSSATNSGTSGNQQEEISTIFVVGFPEDMQEREFQNMFTFSPGFEAATLKIPNKEYTAYGAVPSNRQGYQYDPYNLVTMNQGGVVVDGGRDGTMSWPAAPPGEDGNPPYGGAPQRKQIIGFAKFRSREEALGARDVLQGRRVDIEKGAVLKAEMAKKNLHTKRGVGPVGNVPSASVPTPGNPLNINTNAPYHHALLNTGGLVPPGADLYLNNDTLTPGERRMGTIEAMGLGRASWREQTAAPAPQENMLGHVSGLVREEEEKRANILGLGPSATRGPRERAEDEERERRRKEKEMRLRAATMSAFEAFHSVPSQSSPGISRQPSNNSSILSPTEPSISHGASPLLPNGGGFQSHLPHKVPDDTLVGPWDHLGKSGSTPRPITTSRRSSPPISAGPAPASAASDSVRTSSPAPALDQKGEVSCANPAGDAAPPSVGLSDPNEQDLARAIGGLAVSTTGGKSSPQLPSPASGASTGSSITRNGVDQNPPINTLYVGNLPTSPPPPGYPQDYLEDSLRELFSTRPGFRRLCFRQKNNGPMCFVEFDDVHFATKALSELYGNTLKGLVKGGGIRLSYSKNPLGVRTPANPAITGSSSQQQAANSAQGSVALSANSEVFQPRQPFNPEDQQAPGVFNRHSNTVVSPPPSASLGSFLSSPPPRFFSSSPSSAAFGNVPPSSGPTSGYYPRGSNMYNFGHGSTANNGTGGNNLSSFGLSLLQHPSIPDQKSDDHLHSPHYMSPPGNNLEATRAG